MFKSQTQILKLISIILLFTLTLTANTPPLNTTYTQGGLLKTATDATGTITYTYDNMGRTTRVDNPDGGFVAYSYDSVGNIIEVQTSAQTITKTYDELSRLKTVTDATGTTTYSYDAIGRQTQVVYPNGTTTNYVYDNRNRVTNITHKSSGGATLQSFTYTLDVVGNRTQVVESSGRTVNYTYNNVNQLTQEVVTNDPNGNNTTTSYSYDLVGNLVTKSVDGAGIAYTYNANDQLTTQDAQTFTYDANGNLTQKDSTTYEHDDKNRLIKVITPTSTIEYSYDVNDNRIAKIVDGTTTSYLIDTNTPYAQVISETKGGATIEYTYGNDLIGNGSQFFLTDALGSTRGLVDSSETLTDSYDYTPYGEIASHVGTSENNFLFTGEQFDKESDNYYLRARYYSPSSTRFIGRDTYDGVAGNPITQNHYLYGNANPTMYVDPSGYMSVMSLTNSMSIMNTLSSIRAVGSSAIARGAIARTAGSLARDIAKGATRGSGKGISTTQMYYILAMVKLYSRLGDETNNDMIPIQVYGSNNLPEHQDHIFDSMIGMGSNGRPTASVLTKRAPIPKAQKSKARNFLRNKSACGRAPRGNQACDEYPYITTLQGGKANFDLGNVSVRLVNRAESDMQGRLIKASYKYSPINTGDNFMVIPLGGRSGYFDKSWKWNDNF